MSVNPVLIYHKGTTAACAQAAAFLFDRGIGVVDHPTPEVSHLLVDVPSFSSDGALRGGGQLLEVLERLPPETVVIGGRLNRPDLHKHRVMDLLADEEYLAKNAAITAHCALEIAAAALSTTFRETPTLIIGWGRIGKCLAAQLSGLGCGLTVAARSAKDRAMLAALGRKAVDIPEIPGVLTGIRLLINTVPAPILDGEILAKYPKCVKLDLASAPGLVGTGVICARGLPGRYAPESSGRLIAETILRKLKEAAI